MFILYSNLSLHLATMVQHVSYEMLEITCQTKLAGISAIFKQITGKT